MRIVHVTDCYLPRLGGIELHVRDLATRQRDQGHGAHILTLTPADAANPVDPPWVHRVAESGARPLGPSRVLAGLERALTGLRPDVVHVHVSVFSPFATMAAHIAGSLGLPTLVTVHSMWTPLGPLPGWARSTMRLHRWPVVWSAVSSAAAAPVERMLGAGHPVHVLPNAVEPADWRLPALRDPARRDGSESLTILSVMRLTRVKRTLPLASMLRQVRDATGGLDVRAVIIGDGPQRGALVRYLRRHDLEGWVTLAGRLDREAIRGHLDHASVFWAPAELESFGIAPLEARTRGLPVVASSRSGVGEYITHGREGLLGSTDEAMVHHVIELLRDDHLRTTITDHNTRVPPRQDWEEACRRTEELYAVAGALVGVTPPHALPQDRS